MPALTTAIAIDYRTIRVSFAGALADRTTGPNGARCPTSWALVGQLPGPVAAVTVQSVDEVSDRVVDLQLSGELTFSADYVLTALPAADGGITGVAAPDNTDTVTALPAPVIVGRKFSIGGLIPKKNWREDDSGDLAKFVACHEDVLGPLLIGIDRWVNIVDPDKAPSAFLDLMLRDLGFRFDEFSLLLPHKRRVVRDLVNTYQLKGTAVGIVAAIRLLLGLDARVWVVNGQGMRLGLSRLSLDWVLAGASVFEFGVQVRKDAGTEFTSDEEKQVRAVIDAWKPANSVLCNVYAVLGPPSTIAAAGSAGHVTVTWGAVANAASYRLYVAASPGVGRLHGLAVEGATSPTVLTVPAGQVRYVVVSAINAAGREGFYSAEAHATAT